MHRLIIIFFALIPFIAKAQSNNPIGDFNGEAFWQKVKLTQHLPARALTANDTVMVVVSNRKEAKEDKLRYMSESCDENSLHYFFVFTDRGIWHVLPTESLERAISLMPDKNRDWVLYTEGMGKLFTTDIFRGLMVAGQYNVNVIMFDYPSITTTKKSFGNYFFAIGNARKAYKYFTPALVQVKQLRAANKMGNGKLSMFYHSMGNHVARQIVKKHKLNAINDIVWVDNLVLNAPCVPRRGHKKWINKIHYAKAIYINYNQYDFTLGGAYLASKKLQLGHKPVRNISDNAVYVNFNTI